jgi:hypothetical protein
VKLEYQSSLSRVVHHVHSFGREAHAVLSGLPERAAIFILRRATMINNNAELAYLACMAELRKTTRGGRLERLSLENGGGFAEKKFMTNVWWPIFGHFDGLHPEHEIMDEKDGPRYLDFAYFSGAVQLCIEIDGYGTHWRDAGRRAFSDHLKRQNQLVIDGWKILRFAYDDVAEKPRHCQQVLLQFLGKWSIVDPKQGSNPAFINLIHQEITKLAYGRDVISPYQVAKVLGISGKTAAKHMRGMMNLGVLTPAWGKKKRIKGYRLTPNRQ